MQIGMFYQIQVPKPWTPTSDFDRYWEMMDQVVLAEELGFGSVWLADHQFRTEWSHSSAPDVTLSAISQRTSGIRLGIAVAVPPVEHPLHIAARTATLDILSNGRGDLGIGRSGYPYQMAAFGTDLANATGMVDEALEIIPRAWDEGELIRSVPDAIALVLERVVSEKPALPLSLNETSQAKMFESPSNETIGMMITDQVQDLKPEDQSSILAGVPCPECQSTLAFEEGCEKCYSCGYSKC